MLLKTFSLKSYSTCWTRSASQMVEKYDKWFQTTQLKGLECFSFCFRVRRRKECKHFYLSVIQRASKLLCHYAVYVQCATSLILRCRLSIRCLMYTKFDWRHMIMCTGLPVMADIKLTGGVISIEVIDESFQLLSWQKPPLVVYSLLSSSQSNVSFCVHVLSKTLRWWFSECSTVISARNATNAVSSSSSSNVQ